MTTTSEDNKTLREMGIDVCPECQSLQTELDAVQRENERHAEFTVDFSERFKAKVRRWQLIAYWGWGTAALMAYIWVRQAL